MQLSESAENFMKNNTPFWHECFSRDNLHSGLECYSSCVVGELKKSWSYATPSSSDYCRQCVDCGGDIEYIAYRYNYGLHQGIWKFWGQDVDKQFIVDKMAAAIMELARHAKEKHPELLKQEKQIATV